ncbi:hypothetical protein F4814DRAFT_453903 [Daldinia grandis]|nr:hypothetical protein F4814DRAFT_453903 [Daldinia grandis]
MRHDGSRSFRSRAKANLEPHGTTIQLSLFITLNARSDHTIRVIQHSDSQCSIKAYRPRPNGVRHIPFDIVLLDHLDTLEESFLTVLRLLHAKQISFPVTAEQIELTQPSGSAHPTLFVPYNKGATWVHKLPSNWQSGQISDAISIFRIARALLRLSDPSSTPALNLQNQQTLARL